MADEPQEITLADLDDIDAEAWNEIIRELAAQWDAKQLKLNNPYHLDLIRVLRDRDEGMERRWVLYHVHKKRKSLGLPIPRTFDNAVQQSCERFCVDSEVFKARNAPKEDGLFCWPRGRGAGFWALRHQVANEWLAVFLAKRKRRKI